VSKDPAQVIVVGGSGAIGQAMVSQLLTCFPLIRVHATYHLSATPQDRERLQWYQLDVRDPEQITSFSKGFDHIDWIINCAGYLHGEHGGPEKNIKSVDADFLS
jgi:nucleoside-diphosphate-sugar epimerase